MKDNQIIQLHTETTIDSAHFLQGYDGNCKNFHGHSWFLEIWIRGLRVDLNEVGILFDFGEVKRIKERFDHKLLNNIHPFTEINPTAENISSVIYDQLKEINPHLLYKIRLYETKVGKETYCEVGDWL